MGYSMKCLIGQIVQTNLCMCVTNGSLTGLDKKPGDKCKNKGFASL